MRIGIILRTKIADHKTVVYEVGTDIKQLKKKTKELNDHVSYDGAFGKVNEFKYELIIKELKLVLK